MSILYMVRHGQASFGQANYDQLSPLGCRQSELLARYFQNAQLAFDTCYTGSLCRQQQTLAGMFEIWEGQGWQRPTIRERPAFDEFPSRAIVDHYLPQAIEEDPALRRDLDRLMLERKAFQRVFERVVDRWARDTAPPAALTSWEAFKGRVRQGLQEVTAENGGGKNVLLVTSGGPITAVVQMALELPDRAAFRIAWQIMNTAVTTFLFRAGEFSLQTFNAVPHLDLAGDGTLRTYR